MSSARTVLLVDDDADFVEMNRMLLEQNGYAVRVAYSGRQCLAEVAAHRPDLIILDMVMENRDDGFDVSRQLRNSEHTKAIPVVMITSANDSIPFHLEPDRTWLPVDTLLEKPVEPQLLLAVVDKALRPKEAPGGRVSEAPARPVNDAQTRPVNDAQVRPANDAQARPVNDAQARPVNDAQARPVDDAQARPG